MDADKKKRQKQKRLKIDVCRQTGETRKKKDEWGYFPLKQSLKTKRESKCSEGPQQKD